MQVAIRAICPLERDGVAHRVFAQQRGIGIDSLIILGSPRDRPCLRLIGETVRSVLVHDHKRVKPCLLGEAIAESQTIVECAENHIHPDTGRVLELHHQFVVVVRDILLFAPSGFPGFGKRRSRGVHNTEPFAQVNSRRRATFGSAGFGSFDKRET